MEKERGMWKRGVGRKKRRRRIYREPVEGGKPARSHSFGPGGPILQLPAFTSSNSVWTLVIYFSFSHSFRHFGLEMCCYTKQFSGSNLEQWEDDL